MAEGLGAGNCEEACKKAGMNTIKEDLEETDMVRAAFRKAKHTV